MSTPRFVVGTGRCGSTLLSRMLAEHREVAAMHECFTGLDWSRRFAPGPVDGPAVADLLGVEQPVTTEVLARGHTSDEIAYPFGAPTARLRPGDPVPWLLITMISRLTDDPHPLFDALLDTARARPPTTMAEHYDALFDWLAAQAGASMWVERSGSSLDYLGELDALFPDARFVHIHRDGHEAALSIRAHPFFRLAVCLLFDLFPDEADPEAAVTTAIDTPPPCWAVGRYWADQVLHGYRAMPDLDPDRLLTVRFEDLVADPSDVVARVASFLDLPRDDGFVERAAALVGPPPSSRFDLLPAHEQDELREACRPGQVLLGRA
jgi:hypothetical protein